MAGPTKCTGQELRPRGWYTCQKLRPRGWSPWLVSPWLVGPGHVKAAAQAEGLKFLGQLPVDPEIARLGDGGQIEKYEADFIHNLEHIIK